MTTHDHAIGEPTRPAWLTDPGRWRRGAANVAQIGDRAFVAPTDFSPVGIDDAAVDPLGRWAVILADGGAWLVRLDDFRSWCLFDANAETLVPAFAPGGRLLALADEVSDALFVWRLDDPPNNDAWDADYEIEIDHLGELAPLSVAISVDGWVALCCADPIGGGTSPVLLVDVVEDQVLDDIEGWAEHGLAFSPDGRYLACLGPDTAIFDLDGGAVERIASSAIAWSPDGRRMAAVSEDGGSVREGRLRSTVPLDWDARTLAVPKPTPEARVAWLRYGGRGERLTVAWMLDTASGAGWGYRLSVVDIVGRRPAVEVVGPGSRLRPWRALVEATAGTGDRLFVTGEASAGPLAPQPFVGLFVYDTQSAEFLGAIGAFATQEGVSEHRSRRVSVARAAEFTPELPDVLVDPITASEISLTPAEIEPSGPPLLWTRLGFYTLLDSIAASPTDDPFCDAELAGRCIAAAGRRRTTPELEDWSLRFEAVVALLGRRRRADPRALLEAAAGSTHLLLPAALDSIPADGGTPKQADIVPALQRLAGAADGGAAAFERSVERFEDWAKLLARVETVRAEQVELPPAALGPPGTDTDEPTGSGPLERRRKYWIHLGASLAAVAVGAAFAPAFGPQTAIAIAIVVAVLPWFASRPGA